MKDEFKKKVEDFIEEKKSIIKSFVGYIPEERIKYWAIAIKEFLPEIQELAKNIKKGINETNWRITIEVRLILMLLRATFRLNTTQLETTLLNDQNSRLFEFLKIFSDHIYISHSEWSNRRDIFDGYISKIEDLAWKIKNRYHELYLEGFVEDYIKINNNLKVQEKLNTVEVLEGINFTRHFPEQILEWDNGYPKDLIYKVFIFMKLRMIPSIPYLEMIINESYLIKSELVPVVGNALGFYTKIPSVDMLYRFHRTYNSEYLEKIMENNAGLLMKEGIINPEILIGDSSTFRTRKDDPDGVKFHERDAETTRVMKFQAIVDPNCIPLTLIPRKGNENDAEGFNALKQKLIWIKEMADRLGVEIKFVLLDAGYSSSEILEFIEQELKATPIVDINSRNSNALKLLKSRLEYFKQYYREILELGTKFPKLAELCYYRFLDDIREAEIELEKIEGITPGIVSRYLKIFREIGIEDFIILYRLRTIIEGLFGMMKGCYALLGRQDRRLPLKGESQAHKHGLFILLAMQYLAYLNYKILNRKTHLLRSLYYIKLKEIEVIY